jgi:membrane associated rhomboid family serine protease
LAGLPGILLSLFLHLDFKHLLANSGALLVLLTLTLWVLGAAAYLVLALVVLVGGGFVWLFGQSHSLHLGASGVIFGLVGFLLAAGLLHRRLVLGLAAGLVLFLYGGLIWALFSIQAGVSWAGHFGGLLAGVLAAWLFRPRS